MSTYGGSALVRGSRSVKVREVHMHASLLPPSTGIITFRTQFWLTLITLVELHLTSVEDTGLVSHTMPALWG